MTTATTPWGTTVVIEEVSLPQRAGEKRFATLVQLLETAKGERLVRFAYATDGSGRVDRSPCGRGTSSACTRCSSGRRSSVPLLG